MAKTRNTKRPSNKRQKTSNNKRYAGINGPRPPPIRAEWETHGDIAALHVRKVYGFWFPWRNRIGDKQGDAATRRQKFLENVDMKKFIKEIKKSGLKSVPYPKHLNGIQLSHKQTQKIEKANKTFKKSQRNKSQRNNSKKEKVPEESQITQKSH